ncbi:MAG TPA: HAD-IC family P-type ATPase [Methanomicrobiales archaeon]|jgi:Cu+-exporting ATPase|nr:HAD-IC family P-type ATPase [Methanomicrobiales archaeon]
MVAQPPPPSVAVVFDSAGTLLRTYRVVKNIPTGDLLTDVETTAITAASDDRALIVLNVRSRDVMKGSPGLLLSEYLGTHQVSFGVSCANRLFTHEEVAEVLYGDRGARVSDLQECIREVWERCRLEALLLIDSGVILNFSPGIIEFTVTSGGRPFPGAVETIGELTRMGVASYIASGDRASKLEHIADHLGIPRDHVYGVATPSLKARIVEDLKERYELVVMVGDGINDLPAFEKADVSILTLQQPGEKPEALFEAVDQVVPRVRDAVTIVRGIARRN